MLEPKEKPRNFCIARFCTNANFRTSANFRTMQNFRTGAKFRTMQNFRTGANFRTELQPHFVSPITFSSELRFG